jgi:hypothetical protein
MNCFCIDWSNPIGLPNNYVMSIYIILPAASVFYGALMEIKHLFNYKQINNDAVLIVQYPIYVLLHVCFLTNTK